MTGFNGTISPQLLQLLSQRQQQQNMAPQFPQTTQRLPGAAPSGITSVGSPPGLNAQQSSNQMNPMSMLSMMGAGAGAKGLFGGSSGGNPWALPDWMGPGGGLYQSLFGAPSGMAGLNSATDYFAGMSPAQLAAAFPSNDAVAGSVSGLSSPMAGAPMASWWTPPVAGGATDYAGMDLMGAGGLGGGAAATLPESAAAMTAAAPAAAADAAGGAGFFSGLGDWLAGLLAL